MNGIGMKQQECMQLKTAAGRKSMDDQIVNFGQIVSNTFKNIKCDDVQEANVVFDTWKKILYSIKGVGTDLHPGNQYEGQNLYEHSRIIDLKNGILLVEADHPGWIQLLQMHKQYILTGIKKLSPQLNVTTIVFKLKGKKGELFDAEASKTSAQKVHSDIQKRIDKEEKALGEACELKSLKKADGVSKTAQKVELPPELNALFDDLKKSVLTNSKK